MRLPNTNATSTACDPPALPNLRAVLDGVVTLDLVAAMVAAMVAPLLTAAVAALLALAPHAALAATPTWQYQGERGPATWGSLRPDYAACARGQRQSPIDIVGARRQALPPLDFAYRPGPLRIVNDGHTVRVRIAPGSQLRLGGEQLALQQFHFHTPGGDKLQGEAFPMAMHLLHKSASGRLVSLVLLFRLGAENAALADWWPMLPARGEAERLWPEKLVDATRLLPAQRGYYRYDGSLTAPPCTEGVLWIVMKQPLELSAAQLARLQGVVPMNARPVQALNGRLVAESP